MSLTAAPYINSGNPLILSMVPDDVRRILDVGCGCGDNALRLRDLREGIEIVGLTLNEEEAEVAAPHLDTVHVIDLEKGLTDDVIKQWGDPFDLVLFSHVLEHLTDPVDVLRRCLTRLTRGGHVLIAVPNVLEWRTRMKFLRGCFVYTEHGILDRTHLRFFTYDTAPEELIAPINGLDLMSRRGRGAVPLGPLRRIGAARSLCAAVDRAGVRLWPNLFAGETAMLACWQEPSEGG